MKAAYYETHGSWDVLQVGELPVPEPADDEVLVQVAAAGVNPIDRRLRAGELTEYITRSFPVTPGWDLTGRIVKLGACVSGWNVRIRRIKHMLPDLSKYRGRSEATCSAL